MDNILSSLVIALMDQAVKTLQDVTTRQFHRAIRVAKREEDQELVEHLKETLAEFLDGRSFAVSVTFLGAATRIRKALHLSRLVDPQEPASQEDSS